MTLCSISKKMNRYRKVLHDLHFFLPFIRQSSFFCGTKVLNSQNASDYTVNEKSREGEQGSKIPKRRKKRHKIHLGEIRRWIFFPPTFSFIISASSATNNSLALCNSASHRFGAAKPSPKKAKGGNVEQWIMMHGE